MKRLGGILTGTFRIAVKKPNGFQLRFVSVATGVSGAGTRLGAAAAPSADMTSLFTGVIGPGFEKFRGDGVSLREGGCRSIRSMMGELLGQ